MGQKIHPYGLRLGIVTDWKSRWYSEKDYAAQVNEDHKIRKYLRDELTRGAVSRIDIERIGDKKVQIDIHTGRPGVVIGRGGSEAERLSSGLEDLSGRNVKFNVIEVANPELDAQLLARSVADQLEGRVAFRRAMKRTVTTAMKAGAEGVRVQAQGRLGGADMGRREWYLEGRVPLHTLRALKTTGTACGRTSAAAIVSSNTAFTPTHFAIAHRACSDSSRSTTSCTGTSPASTGHFRLTRPVLRFGSTSTWRRATSKSLPILVPGAAGSRTIRASWMPMASHISKPTRRWPRSTV